MAIEIARPYTAPINITASFAVQIDILEITPAAGKPVMLLGWEFGQLSEVGDAQEEWLELVLKYYTTAGTSGSGGGTSTFRPTTPNSTAAAVALEVGNTTKYTGGTSIELARFPWNVRQTCLFVPIIEERFVADAAKPLVLELVTTPADAIVGVKGRVLVGELI